MFNQKGQLSLFDVAMDSSYVYKGILSILMGGAVQEAKDQGFMNMSPGCLDEPSLSNFLIIFKANPKGCSMSSCTVSIILDFLK